MLDSLFGTGAEIHIESKRVPRFVPGKALKDAVNELAMRMR